MSIPPLLAFSLNKLSGIPALASEHGEMVDHMLELVHWFMLVLFVGWSAFLVIVFTKFRKKRQTQADYYGVRGHATTHIELGVVIVEIILLLGFAFPLWAERADDLPTGATVLKMRAVGEKFVWSFQYPGLDGTLGGMALKYVDVAARNAIGRDLKDPNGKDDFVKVGTMTIPLGRPVIVEITSKDVIHNLCLTPMRMAQDAVPGVRAQFWFKPTKLGKWDIICGQLCGPGHSGMKASLEVVSQKDFDDFMKENSEEALKASEAAEAPPVPAAPAAPQAQPK
ncbi:MAG TPA: cytochrome c oxidase subunit II [Verrucomicrobiaceae bacterium]